MPDEPSRRPVNRPCSISTSHAVAPEGVTTRPPDTIVLAISRPPCQAPHLDPTHPSVPRSPCGLGGERLLQSVPQEVEGHHREEDRQTGEGHVPPLVQVVVA